MMIPINVINRDISIWGEDAAEFKFVLFLILLLIGYLTSPPLDLSVGRIFRVLPLLYLESGRTLCHSLGDLGLVSVFDFHLWSESFIFPLIISIQHRVLIIFFYLLCIRIKALLFILIRAFEIDLAVSPKDVGSRFADIQRPILLTDPENSNQMPILVRPVSNF